MDKVWMKPPFGAGDPKQVDATPEILIPLMVAGWSQIEEPINTRVNTPAGDEEVTGHVHD